MQKCNESVKSWFELLAVAIHILMQVCVILFVGCSQQGLMHILTASEFGLSAVMAIVSMMSVEVKATYDIVQ